MRVMVEREALSGQPWILIKLAVAIAAAPFAVPKRSLHEGTVRSKPHTHHAGHADSKRDISWWSPCIHLRSVVWAGRWLLSHSGWSDLEGWLARICHGRRASNRIRFRRRLRQHSRCQPKEIHDYRETYFRVNHRRIIRHFEAFGCLIPIGSNPLGCQLNPLRVFIHYFT